MEHEFQTRSEKNGIQSFFSFRDALEAALKDETIWKISFTVNKERIRLVRSGIHKPTKEFPVPVWIYEPIL